MLSGRFWNESFVSLPFSPLLERYYYGGLTRSGYIGYLVAFNAPKLLFLLQLHKC